METKAVQMAVVRADMAIVAARHVVRVAVPVVIVLGFVAWACCMLRRGR